MAGHSGSLTAPAPDALADPRAALGAELPGLEVAFEAVPMASRLEEALLGGPASGRISSCTPGHATYVSGHGLALRYDVVVAAGRDHEREAVVNARLFHSRDEARAYVDGSLRPLARAAEGHPLLRSFARRAVAVDDLAMALSVFPVDGALPTLVPATDSRRMRHVLGAALGRGVVSCDVALGHYGRRHRCVLRYEAVLEDALDGDTVVYGKVASDDRGAIAHAALGRLQAASAEGGLVRVPRSRGYVGDLRLLLLEAIPGAAGMGRLIEDRVRERSSAVVERAAVNAMDSAAAVLAVLHGAMGDLGPRRDATSDAALVARAVQTVASVSPDLAARLGAALGAACVRLDESEALPEAACHGDFSHGQILLDGARGGVVDFDTVCRGEPALDVGHFLAYLRLAGRKAAPAPGTEREVVDELGDRFIASYAGAAALDEGRLRERTAGYEILSLVRLGAHSWQKLKTARLRHVLTILEERL